MLQWTRSGSRTIKDEQHIFHLPLFFVHGISTFPTLFRNELALAAFKAFLLICADTFANVLIFFIIDQQTLREIVAIFSHKSSSM